MSRIPKYKAFDKRKSKIREVSELKFDGEFYQVRIIEPTEIAPRNWSLRMFNEVELIEFTGIKDVNGNEIFEGDCDAVGNVVEFVNGSWCLNGDRPLTSRFIKAGNIYEQKESI